MLSLDCHLQSLGNNMMDFNPDAVAKRLYELGRDYAEANDKAERLEYRRHIVLAEIANQATEASEAARDRFARSHELYAKHVEEMVSARTASNIAKARYDADKVRVDLLRTKAASERLVNQHQ